MSHRSMPRRPTRWIAIVALTAGLPGGLAGSPARESEPTVLPGFSCGGLFIVSVAVGADGGRTLELLLDTGASRTYVDPRALARVSGRRAAKASLHDVRIGTHRLGKLEARALPMRRLSLAVGREIDGILGFPAFRDDLLTLDYPAREVRVAAGRLPAVDDVEIFRVTGKRPHLHATVAGRRLRLLVDSGATGRLQVRRRDQVPWAVEPRPATSATIVGGAITKLGGRVAGSARIGPLVFDDPIATIGSENLAGWHVLRHFVLTFDQKNGRVRIVTTTPGPVRMPPFLGMGWVREFVSDGVRVVRVFPGGPASEAGLRAGDIIVAIDGEPVDSRGCALPPTDPDPTPQTLTYVRDGFRAQLSIRTDVLIP